MPFYTYSGSWQTIKKAWVYVSSAWQPIKKAWVWVSDEWRLFFSGENVPSIAQQVTITQSTPDAIDGLITLTGTNYHWTDFVSLTYYFEWSSDGGSSWTIINTGSITNPSSGSSNQKFYTVTIANTSPNIDNLYRFRVFAQNVTLTNSSTSTSTTISTPRNITNVSATQVGNTLQASLSFTLGLYTNSIRVTTNRYNGATFVSSSTTDLAAASPASITLPAYNQTYKFQITPYTQTLISGNVRGYPGNQTAETAGLIIGAAPAPSQITKPTLSSTGSVIAGTILTASNGTYNNASSVATRVYGWYPSPSLTDGTTTNPSPNQASLNQSFTTAQYLQNYVFYAVDIVLGINGSTYYYFSTLSATVYLPSFTDNFNRANTTGSQGIGQTSGGSWYWSNDSVGTYGWQMPTTDTNNFSWEINNNTLYNTRTPSFFDNVGNYPMKSLDVGDSNVSISASIPDGGGGPGLVYWVTGAGSWWATVPSYYFETVTQVQCTGGPTQTSTTSGCCSFNGPYDQFGCVTTTAGSWQCPSPSAYANCTCTQGTPSSSTTTCSGGSVSQCNSAPSNGCGTLTTTLNSLDCQSCPTPTTSSPKYPDNTLGFACFDKCSCLGPFTETSPTTYSCGTTETALGSPVVVVATCNSSNVGQPCNQRIVREDGFTVYYVKYCVSTPGTTSTYYHCTTRGCGTKYTYSASNVTTTTPEVKATYGVYTVIGSYYNCYTNQSVSVTTYYSRIRILSANGSSVSSMAEQIVATSTSSYQRIYGISTDTSNNTITAKAYSNTTLTTQMGSTLTYTATAPTKIVGGQSAVGIVNSPTNDNRQTGNRLDNFTYTNV
jgi:hypothetical protein